MEVAVGTKLELCAAMRELQEKVVDDLALFAKRLLEKPQKPFKQLKIPQHAALEDQDRDQDPGRAKAEPERAKAEPGEKVKVEQESDDEASAQEALVEAPPEPLEPPEPFDNPGSMAAEALMSKVELVALHKLVKLGKGDEGKKNGMWCRCCKVAFEARNRAKVFQHVRSQQHRAKFFTDVKKEPTPPAPVSEATESVRKDVCDGISLNGSFGKKTRLGSDLRPVWDEFVQYADLSEASNINGMATHRIVRLCQSDDWRLQHRTCFEGNSNEPTSVPVSVGADGEAVCSSCLQLGNCRRLLQRVTDFVKDLDMVRLLFKLMFAADKVEEFKESLTSKAIYTRRCKVAYDAFLSMSGPELHTKVRHVWYGKQGVKSTEAMKHFMESTVFPCLDCDPSNPMKSSLLDSLMKYMRCEESADVLEADLRMVRAIVTGSLNHHPAIHGLVVACMNRVTKEERGNSTFRDAHRGLDLMILDDFRQAAGVHPSGSKMVMVEIQNLWLSFYYSDYHWISFCIYMLHDISAYFWCYDSLGLFDPSFGGLRWWWLDVFDYQWLFSPEITIIDPRRWVPGDFLIIHQDMSGDRVLDHISLLE